jgi:outer membrane receptor protein involved in Fe transport
MTVRHSAIDAAVKVAVTSSKRFEPRLPKHLTRTVWTAALVLGLGATAQAQQAQQGPAKPADETASQAGAPAPTLEEITVTGSRIKRTSDFTTPTPTTVIDNSQMENLGMVNIGQTLTLTPANASTFTPASTGNQPYFVGAYIPDLRGLNPYFGSRTLVMVDGQRFVQTAQGDQIDLNFIPQILTERVDVVTGGASAAYGSGAIAGVENIILTSKLEGGKITGDWAESSRADAKDRHFGAAYGHGFFDDRVHFVIGGEIEHQDGLGCENVRAWCASNQGFYQSGLSTNPSATAIQSGAGLSSFNSPYGVFVTVPPNATQTVQGNPAGNAALPFGVVQPYASAGAAFINVQPGGDGIPIYQYNNLVAPVSRGNIMTMLSGNITDDLHWKASGYYGDVKSTRYQGTVATQFYFLPSDNAYIQNNSLGTAFNGHVLIPANPFIPLSYAPINKDWTTQMPAASIFDTKVKRVTAGLDGKFGQSSWSWDANFEYGLTNRNQTLVNNTHNYAMSMALDSVLVNGTPECRVTALAQGAAGVAPNPLASYAAAYAANPLLANGCVPIDPFGNQPLSQAQQRYAFGNLVELLRYQQTDANVNASGELFDGIGAGPWTAATGYEFRQETGSNMDQPGVPAYIGQDYNTQFGQSFGGIVTVHEGYLETSLPLLKDLPAAKMLLVDFAGRESRYQNRLSFTGVNAFSPFVGQSFSHNLTTWKATLQWNPVDWLQFRTTQSRDSRAANFRELYYGQVIGAGGTFGYCDPSGGRLDPCTWNLEGNPNLRPETSDTTTLGLVFTPTDWVSGLSFSADWFHIKIKNAIEQANPTILTDGCASGITADCNQMTFYNPGPNNNLTQTNASLATTPTQIAAAQQFYQSCFNNPAGNAGCVRNVAAITPQSYNGAFYEVRGIDFSLQDTFDAGAFGTFSTRLLTTWMDQQTFANCTLGAAAGCFSYNILGQTGSGNQFLNDYTPDARWRGSLIVTWTEGPVSLTPSMNFVSQGKMDYLGLTPADGLLYRQVLFGNLQGVTPTACAPNCTALPASIKNYGYHPMNDNHVPSYFLFNLNGTYTFKEGAASGMQLYVQVNNVFNKKPPFADGGGGFGPTNSNGGTNPIFFDTIGLYWRAGFRYQF